MFRKSLLSAITIFLAGQFCLISESVTAGSFTDYIRKECPREYDLYKSAVTEFAIRMKPNVGQCGCDVVGLYYALSRNSMELVAQLEEDAELMQSAARVFGISEELTEALGNAPEAVSTLTILTEHDPRLFRKLSDALSLFSRSDRKKLSKNPNYILYYLLAAAMADAQGSEITSMVKRLKRRVAPARLMSFPYCTHRLSVSIPMQIQITVFCCRCHTWEAGYEKCQSRQTLQGASCPVSASDRKGNSRITEPEQNGI